MGLPPPARTRHFFFVFLQKTLEWAPSEAKEPEGAPSEAKESARDCGFASAAPPRAAAPDIFWAGVRDGGGRRLKAALPDALGACQTPSALANHSSDSSGAARRC